MVKMWYVRFHSQYPPSTDLWRQDNGAHSVACEKCNVWQHSQCLGIRRIEAEKDDFHFVCKDCQRNIENAGRPNIKLKFRAGLSSSPPQVREKHPAETPSPTVKFKAVEVPAQQLQSVQPRGQDQDSDAPMSSPRKVAKGIGPSPYLQHAASNAPNGHPSNRTSKSPNTPPSSESAHLNGSYQRHAIYPYPSNPPRHLTPVPPTYTNGHVSNSFQVPAQHFQGSRRVSGYGNYQYSKEDVHQPQVAAHQRHLLIVSTPQAQTKTNQTPTRAVPGPDTQNQGRHPSPVLHRPSMSPTQGNYDVGPVAGVPERSPNGLEMSSPPSQLINHHHHNRSVSPLNNNPNHATPCMNGAPNVRVQNAKLIHNRHQHQPLSGLSPTKHSPSLPPGEPYTIHNGLPSPTHVPSAIGHRSVSGTPIFPPTEMLQPSPNQLRKSPVPTPSKAMTSANIGEGELKRINEEIRNKVEEERTGGQ